MNLLANVGRYVIAASLLMAMAVALDSGLPVTGVVFGTLGLYFLPALRQLIGVKPPLIVSVGVTGAAPFALFLAVALDDPPVAGPPAVREVDAGPVASDACAGAFAAAAAVSPYQDRHEDLFPAYSACTSVGQWREANRRYPAAIDGVEPVQYAMTVCAGNQGRLGSTPMCRAVNAPPPAQPSDLQPSGRTGLLGAPLPVGAELLERTPGDPQAGRDPSERYRVSATASETAAFFTRQMVASGWARDGVSSDVALFFQKGNLMLGVLINGSGGTFTLMGS